MRVAMIAQSAALRERMSNFSQVNPAAPEAEMPPYMESFLAHLRLLIGVPFVYLIPDARLLPTESIRFFYLDRSWTDRLVDGAVAVGKIGTREQSHHESHSAALQQQLDQTERIVRALQRGGSFIDLRPDPASAVPANVVTGFLLRSSLVSGWAQMDVRAYSKVIEEHYLPSDPKVTSLQLTTLRLERLSPSILLALFQGIPQMVTLEEPHHSIQFGVAATRTNLFQMDLRDPSGEQILYPDPNIPADQIPIPVTVPIRAGSPRVVDILGLWNNLKAATVPASAHDQKAPLSGGGSFALQALNPPWRQHFQGTKDEGGGTGQGGFSPSLPVAVRVGEFATQQAFEVLVKG
jgi:hypothetical protein